MNHTDRQIDTNKHIYIQKKIIRKKHISEFQATVPHTHTQSYDTHSHIH